MTLPRFPSGSSTDLIRAHRNENRRWPVSDERVLVLTAAKEEADFFRAALAERGLKFFACAGMEDLCRGIKEGAGMAIVAAESLADSCGELLATVLAEQSSWSDFPLVVLADGGEEQETVWSRWEELGPVGNVRILARPMRAPIAMGVVQAALQSRRRQYEVRDQLLEQERHEKAAREAEERLRLTFESAKDYAILSLDLQGRVTTWSAGAEQIFGYSEQEILGREVAVLFTPEDRKAGVPEKEMGRAAKAGVAEDDRWHLCKDGRRFFASGMMRPILDGPEKVCGFTKVARDITWRKQAKENLEKERNFSNAAINSLPGIFYVLDEQGRMLRWNENLERVSGYSALEIAGMHPLDFVIEEHRPLIGQKITEVFRSGEVMVEADLRCKNGSRIPYLFTGKRFATEETPWLVGMGMDIKAQKKVERELRKLHALAERRVAELDAVIESMPDAVYIGTEKGITKCNANALKMLGVASLEDLNARIGESGVKFAVRWLNGQPLKTEEFQFVRALHGELTIEDIIVRKADTGEDVYLRAASAPVMQGGRIVGVVAINSDMTERMKAKEAQANLAAIVEFSTDAIIGKNLEGIITSWNVSAERIFGYRAEEVIGHPIEILLPPDRLSEEADIMARLRRGERTEHFESVRVAKGGRNIQVSLTISPIKNASGNIIGVSKIARDITEHKQAEESIKAARDQISRHALELEKRVTERTASLRQSVQSLEGVLYHVAHDLRAPLRAMQGFTTILLNEYAPKLDEKGEDYAQRVSTSASRMDTLIQDLLRYGRLAHTPLSLVAVNLNQELEVVQGRLAEKIRNKGAVISVESPLPEVWADPVVLDEILSNLLKNALTFVAPGVQPKIHIRAEPAGPGLVRIWMEDNGVGIGAEHHERIFRVFERLQIEDVYTGTGIGLALVRKGMERMGGRSGVESKAGEGSRFWLELPTMQRMNE